MSPRSEPDYEPTPKQIIAETAKIRRGWKDGLEQTRTRKGPKSVKKIKDYVPRVCRFYGCRDGSVGMEMVEGLSVEVE